MTTEPMTPARKAAVRKSLDRLRDVTGVNILWNVFLLCLIAWRADGHYSQPALWSIGLLFASLTAWLCSHIGLRVLLTALR